MASDLDKVMPRNDADGTNFQPTVEGNKALSKGRKIYDAASKYDYYGMRHPSASDINEKIGKDLMLEWFGMFYRRMMADPRMAVLFDTSHADTNVSAAIHGERLALALMTQWCGDPGYYKLRGRRGTHMFHVLQVSHQRAKGCPMRSRSLQGRGFTVDQRDSWLGHLWYAGEECSVPSKLRDHIVLHLGTAIGLYGPFVKNAGASQA